MFYTDLYIQQDLLAVYLNTEEFIFEFDERMVKEKGPDFYLGHILKELETKLQKQEEFKKKFTWTIGIIVAVGATLQYLANIYSKIK